MRAKFYKAIFNHDNKYQHVECVKLHNLFVCAKIQAYPEAHLVYDKPDFIDELRRLKYTVQETELDLPLDENTFNELDFSNGQTEDSDIYVFKDFAIRITDAGMDVYCQTGMTPADISKHWNLKDEFDETSLDEVCKVSRDRPGSLAVKVDHMFYEVWDLAERSPGEFMDVEERLEIMTSLCEALSCGEDLSDVLEERADTLQGSISEWQSMVDNGCDNENLKFLQGNICEAKKLFCTIEALGKECRDYAAGLNMNEQSQPERQTGGMAQGMGGMK